MTAVGEFELAAYQRAVRTLLANPLITESYPDQAALPQIRRWAEHLREDLDRAFGYRLELRPTTARLVRTLDELDASRPARTATDRPFDRRRYAYLALTLAVLGRAGAQLALSELADSVAADANRIHGLGLSTERATDRAAFVDAVAWLETRGAVRLADGSARRWADDPQAGEALYDVDRDVVAAVYRPTRVLQHVDSVTALLGGARTHLSGTGRDARRRQSGQQARRALVERPVVYLAEVGDDVRGVLRGPHAVAEVERLTGLVAERRSEGIALLDTSGGFSDRRFPGSGTVGQTALLLVNAIADRIEDVDAPEPARVAAPDGPLSRLADTVDAGLPRAGVIDTLAAADAGYGSRPAGPAEPAEYPLIEEGWLAATMSELLDRYGSTFAAHWRADPARLLATALDLLTDLRMVVRVPGGVLALPLLARYRHVVVTVRKRVAEPTLFDMADDE
ncbi:MAG: TIGR02678 family protein [Pseudonocardia sp.]|nr:TIGR02678 family protein [Pseudonocardia sp.]